MDEDDDFDDYLDEDEVVEKKRPSRFKAEKNDYYEETAPKRPSPAPAPADFKKERASRMEKNSSSKVVPIRTTSKGLEVCIMKPSSFEDSQMICDILLSGRATVINLEGFDDKLAQRTMDFISGCVYAINGRLHRISNCIFIVSPDTIDISGDYLDLIKDNNFEPPTFHSKF